MRRSLRSPLAVDLLVPLSLAAVVRLAPAAGSGFPLNDGGMFWTMAGDLQANGMVPPMFTSYNGGSIPFAYPPLGIYAAAIFHGPDGNAGLMYATWLPAILSTIAVALIFALALEMSGSRISAFVAASAFALLPAGFERMIEGGGVTRALGALLMLVSAWATLRARIRADVRWDVTAALFGGLALLSHPTAGVAAMVAAVALRPELRLRGSLAALLATLAGMALVASPWWLGVLARHGPDSLLSAASLGGPVDAAAQAFTRLITWAVSGELYFPYIGALGLLGMLVAISGREWRLPVWMALQILVEPRLGFVFACVPLALMAGQAGSWLLDSLLPPAGRRQELSMAEAMRSSRGVRWAVPVSIAIITVTVAWTLQRPEFPARAIGADIRAAMTWVRQQLPASASFAVVTGDVYGYQGTDEWFPSLTERVSVATQQGTEWIGRGTWREAFLAHAGLQACAGSDTSCLDEWAAITEIEFEYVFIPKGQLYGPMSPGDCCGNLRASLAESSRARVVFDGPGASIWEYAPPHLARNIVSGGAPANDPHADAGY